jgi:hypothetical protein
MTNIVNNPARKPALFVIRDLRFEICYFQKADPAVTLRSPITAAGIPSGAVLDVYGVVQLCVLILEVRTGP